MGDLENVDYIDVQSRAAAVESRVLKLIDRHGLDKDAILREMDGTGDENEAAFCFDWIAATRKKGFE